MKNLFSQRAFCSLRFKMLSGQHVFNAVYLRSWSRVSGSTSPRVAERGFSILLHSTILFYAVRYPGMDGSDAQLENIPYYGGEAGIQSTSGSGAILIPTAPSPAAIPANFPSPANSSYRLCLDLLRGFTVRQTTRPPSLRGRQTDSWAEGQLKSPLPLAPVRSPPPNGIFKGVC